MSIMIVLVIVASCM